MLKWFALLIMALTAACTFKPDTNDLRESLRGFPMSFDLETVEVVLSKGKGFGPQSGYDICYVLKLDEDAFPELANQVRLNGSEGASGVYEQNSICDFGAMRDTYGVSPIKDAYNFEDAKGTRLDVLFNEDKKTVLLFFWRT